MSKTSSIWGGRFDKKQSDLMLEINSSIDIDKRMFVEDITGSIAHCKMLAKQKIITKDESELIISGLKQIQNEIECGNFQFSKELEDIHMNVENRLKEIIGDVAGKLHTARSRNDQVATDFKLYVRNNIDAIIELLKDFERSILNKAKYNYDVIMPAFTHLQVAQPTTFGHYLLCYFEMFLRDIKRLKNCRNILNECPLGSCALCGTPFNTDRFFTAEELGFDCPTRNSIDGVSDRDFAIEFLSCLSIIAMHLSRLGEEFIIWSSQQFNYISLPEEYTSGSSIMPQKKNPDSCELLRGKAGKIYGNLFSILTIMKGLPLAYQKDMQEDKEVVFNSIDNIVLCIKVSNEIIKGIIANKDAMKKSLLKGYPNATDLADYLVKKINIPFREAHRITGEIVKIAEKKNVELEKLELKDMQKFCDKINKDVFDCININTSLNSRKSYGGTSTENVRRMIIECNKIIDEI